MARPLAGSQVVSGLDTYTFTVTIAGPHFVSATSTDVPLSGVQLVVNLNGSPVATSPAVATSKQAVSVKAAMNCAVNDVITVVISSATALDALTNNIKTTILLSKTQLA